MRVNGKSVPLLLLCLLLVSATVSTAFGQQSVSAAQITDRKVELLTGSGGDGGSKAGGVVNHRFTFTVPTAANIGSIKFEYCTIASGTCTMPTGLVTTAATLGDQQVATGFTLVNTTNGSPYVTRTAAAVASGASLIYRLDSITNPTAENEAFFIRISTYTSTDATTGQTDTGTVAATTARQIELTGTMPESLIFCTGETISLNGSGVPDCSTATAGSVAFNQLFSPTDTATATSQMAASTNGTTGYSITINGPTLTSGSNTIPAMATAAAPVRGTSQFGMNLRANTVAVSTPAVGADLNPASDGVDKWGLPTTDYNTPDTFKFASGDSVAQSNYSSTPSPTNSQIYTSSYIVNVSGSQLAGTYATTLTYVCTATF